MLGYGRGASAFEQKGRRFVSPPARVASNHHPNGIFGAMLDRRHSLRKQRYSYVYLPTLFSFSEGRKKDISSVLKLLSLLIFELYLNIHLIQNIYSSM
jgi:hypothetical protein